MKYVFRLMFLIFVALNVLPALAGDNPYKCPSMNITAGDQNEKPILTACYWIDAKQAVVSLEMPADGTTTNIRVTMTGIAKLDEASQQFLITNFYAASNGAFGVTITPEGSVFLADQTWGKFYLFEQSSTAQGGWTRKEGRVDAATQAYSGDEISLRTEHDWSCPTLQDEEKNIFSAGSCYWVDANNVFTNTIGADGSFYGTWFDVRGVDKQYMTISDHTGVPGLAFSKDIVITATTDTQVFLKLAATGRLANAYQ